MVGSGFIVTEKLVLAAVLEPQALLTVNVPAYVPAAALPGTTTESGLVVIALFETFVKPADVAALLHTIE